MLSILFNSALREKILLYLVERGEAYSLELAKNFAANLFAVQNQMRRLEEAGILVSRNIGKTRMYTLNPRYFLKKELIALMKKNLAALPKEEIRKYYRPGKRPGMDSKETITQKKNRLKKSPKGIP
jgi:DNA-binding transcriptional ArsR family regulator